MTADEIRGRTAARRAAGASQEYPQHAGGPRPHAPARPGPGTELAALLASLGLGQSAGCGCDGRRRQMDAWGPEGCRGRRAEIEAWLRSEAQKVGWGAKLKAGAAALANGLVLNPLDPAPGLLDEAIRRSEAKGT